MLGGWFQASVNPIITGWVLDDLASKPPGFPFGSGYVVVS